MAEKLKYYLEKLLSLLRVRTLVAGLEISDLVLRLSCFDGLTWHFYGIRLNPGIMDAGKVKNYDGFIAALKALKSQAFGERERKRKVNVIVSLSSINIYSQVFSLPMIEGANLEKAIQLNIQMTSPMDIAQTYSGWQQVGEDQRSMRFEILSAFIDRPTVDEINRAISDAGFLAAAIEPRALAISRVLKEAGAGFDAAKSYIVISLDNSGLDFLIIRQGQLYFEYFNPWRDIVDEKGQIPTEAFRAAVIRSLHQVLNFYSQHWPETVSDVLVAATALDSEIEKIVTDSFFMSVSALRLSTLPSVGPEWFVALGCGIRGLKPRSRDKEMSLLGIGAEAEFRREQAIGFAKFWRVLIPAGLGLLFIAFLLADLFLIQTRKSVEAQSLFNLNADQARQNEDLQNQAREFNRTVELIRVAQSSSILQGVFLETLSGIASANNIVINRFSFEGTGGTSLLEGEARSADLISNFKKALEGGAQFKNVELPLAGIKEEQGKVRFSMSFRYAP